jgi:TolB-like protein
VLGEQVDHRTDVFSLGIVLFEMLTGRLPFSGATPAAIALQIVQAAAPLPSAINGALPVELDPIVAKALAKSLDQRYGSAAAVAAELRTVAAILDVRSGAAEPEASSRAIHAPARRAVRTSGALVLLIVALSAGAWWQRSSIERAWRHTMGPAPPPVIAVMPLAVSGADTTATFFADGLTDDLITRLGQTPGVTVIGRAGLSSYRARAPRDVARELGAAVVLTGSMTRMDDDVRVTLTLADVVDDESLWTGEYTRPVKDIFGLQVRAAEDVAQALHVPVQPTAATARTASRQVDRTAYEHYLQGRQAAANGQPAEAAQYYEEAIAADDGLPEAFAGLAHVLRAGAERTPSDAAARRERIKTAAERAYQLDPDLAATNVAMALASSSLPQTLQYLSRAIDLDPSDGENYRDIADVIEIVDPELSAAFGRRALELDPHPAAGRTPAPVWHPAIAGEQRPSEALARDHDLARSAVAKLLERRQ